MKDALLISQLTRAIGRSTLKLTPLAWLLAAATAHANDIAVTDAWTPPNAEIGSDAVLGMVVTNDGADPDALVRVSCPVANFSEKRQIDIGEGGKSARAVHDIPIAVSMSFTLREISPVSFSNLPILNRTPRATKPSTGTFAIVTRPGVCETSRLSMR
jgi:hypothetical protein